jgi:GNAT superfamily N-acetyltransferase
VNIGMIREARPDEATRVALLLRAAYQQYQKAMPPDSWQFYLADIMNVRGRLQEAHLLVAEVDDRLIGTVTLYMDGEHSSETDWPEGWAGLRLLGVDPQYRNRGIGRGLMEECIRRCRERGIKTIGLHTADIMDVAKGMYERMGFKPAPEFDHHPRPDITIMAYRLDL